ncbi:MAG: response regulator [Candidatus Saccharimonas sp.]
MNHQIRKVLIVDDDEWLVELMSGILQKKSEISIESAANGVEAMQSIELSVPDMIIMDMFMPGPDGLVVLHELQSYTDLALIPVVLCTNSAQDIEASAEWLQEYGVRSIIDKATMTPGSFAKVVEGILA